MIRVHDLEQTHPSASGLGRLDALLVKDLYRMVTIEAQTVDCSDDEEPPVGRFIVYEKTTHVPVIVDTRENPWPQEDPRMKVCSILAKSFHTKLLNQRVSIKHTKQVSHSVLIDVPLNL